MTPRTGHLNVISYFIVNNVKNGIDNTGSLRNNTHLMVQTSGYNLKFYYIARTGKLMKVGRIFSIMNGKCKRLLPAADDRIIKKIK